MTSWRPLAVQQLRSRKRSAHLTSAFPVAHAQLRIHHTNHSDFKVHIASGPIIEDTRYDPPHRFMRPRCSHV